MTLRSAVVPLVCTFSVPWNEAGRSMSPVPPTSSVPVSGAPSLVRTKCALSAASRVFLAFASRSGADVLELPPPLHPARTTAATSGTTARRSSMTPPSPCGPDSSARGRSGAGAGPCGDAPPQPGQVLVREELQGGFQLGQPV